MSEVQDILNQVDRVKLSIIMQVNLQNYDSSREDPNGKFTRMVESFKNQLYKNCELIIVADGCNKTHQLYSRSFSNDSNIKFIYLDRQDTPKMYDVINDEGHKYYRGLARNVGASIATGELITYVDSDDYMLPEFAMTCMLVYNTSKENDWWVNTSWYDFETVSIDSHKSEVIKDPKDTEAIEIENLDGAWKAMQLEENRMIMAPWLLMHKSSCATKWRDTAKISEDVDFSARLRQEYPNGTSYNRPIYVRCHVGGQWDV